MGRRQIPPYRYEGRHFERGAFHDYEASQASGNAVFLVKGPTTSMANRYNNDESARDKKRLP